jgi:energy-coupling factor transport system substrate-specific component
MSWQAGSLVLLGLVLLAGFGWYERRRPPAKVLALVAALAALAVIGRIAFAAIPNVKPSTDIVLFAGYALGAVPGFVVGAVFALVSNFFLGQGPWTVWQMAGWGGVAVAGAALAKAMRQREEPGRLKLAIACGAAGLAFGAWMDVYQWTLAARQDVGTYVAVSGTSLPYNLAHAIGNVVFCLLIGPAFVRALTRYRRRFEVRWPAPLKPAAVATIALLVVLAVPAAAVAVSPASRAARFLERSQNLDGGFGPARGQPSNQLHAGWAALGLASAGRNPRDVRRGDGRTIASYLRRGLSTVREIGEIERTILVLKAAGLSPERFGGRNLLAELIRKRRGDGSFAGFTSYTAFGILALRASGERVGKQTAGWLAGAQNEDGGFGVSPEAGSDADMTGVGLQALAAIGRSRGAAARDAVAWLRAAQNGDGGFSLSKGGDSNSQSTAYAVTGLIAVDAGDDVVGRGLAYIRARQRSDGSVAYSASGNQTPVWVTAQALLALRRAPFPLGTVPRERPKPKPKARGSRPDRPTRRDRNSKEGKRDSRVRTRAQPIVRVPGAGTSPGEVSSLRRTSSEGSSDDDRPSGVVLALAVGATLVAVWLGRRRLLSRRR